MLEPIRNDVCAYHPITRDCAGKRLRSQRDQRIHLDSVKSNAIIGILNDCHHTMADLIALGNVVRMTCWT